MGSIARKHAMTVKQLSWYNPKVVRLRSGDLGLGQSILIPARATIGAATDVPNPSIERYPKKSRRGKRKVGKGHAGVKRATG